MATSTPLILTKHRATGSILSMRWGLQIRSYFLIVCLDLICLKILILFQNHIISIPLKHAAEILVRFILIKILGLSLRIDPQMLVLVSLIVIPASRPHIPLNLIPELPLHTPHLLMPILSPTQHIPSIFLTLNSLITVPFGWNMPFEG